MRAIKNIAVILVAALLFSTGVAAAGEKSVGIVLSGDLPRYHEAVKAFTSALARAGYGQDKVQIFTQVPNPDQVSWMNSVRKFIGVDVNVIVAFGAPAAAAALKETSSLPVVFAYVYDPVASGVKKQNSTGVNSKVPAVTLLKTLKSITPFSKLAVVYNPDERDSVVQLEDISKISGALGFQVIEVSCKSTGEVRGKLQKVIGQSDCVYISCSSAVGKDAAGIIAAAGRSKIPAVSQVGGMAEKGVLLALAPSASEQGELAAAQVAKILGGASPSSIAMDNAKKIDFILNLKAANALDIKVPFDVLNAATKVIK